MANSFDWLLSCDWFAFLKLNLQIIRNWVCCYFEIKRNEIAVKKFTVKKCFFFPDIKVKGLFLKAKSLDKIQISIPVFFNHLLTVASTFMHDWPIRSVVRWYSDAAFAAYITKTPKASLCRRTLLLFTFPNNKCGNKAIQASILFRVLIF